MLPDRWLDIRELEGSADVTDRRRGITKAIMMPDLILRGLAFRSLLIGKFSGAVDSSVSRPSKTNAIRLLLNTTELGCQRRGGKVCYLAAFRRTWRLYDGSRVGWRPNCWPQCRLCAPQFMWKLLRKDKTDASKRLHRVVEVSDAEWAST